MRFRAGVTFTSADSRSLPVSTNGRFRLDPPPDAAPQHVAYLQGGPSRATMLG